MEQNDNERIAQAMQVAVEAGWITYLCILRLAGASVIESTFIATLIVVIVSRFMTVRRKCPVTIFEICGIYSK